MNNKAGTSLEEVNSSVDTTSKTGTWKKIFAFFGPAYLVSVGYMDPGNWATDIAGGSKFGYALIWVLLMSNLMALLLQGLSARLGLVKKLDLAQASRVYYPPFANKCLWVLAEIAIAACDLAEVIGMAIGLQLLFNIPIHIGVLITILDTFLLLMLQNLGMRKMEAFILSLIGIIGVSFMVELFMIKPDIIEIAKGLKPSLPGMGNEALYIAIGIIGATVMPHNLYLHSSLVQTRKIDRSSSGIRSAIKYNLIDTGIALNLALFVNAAILILAASAFYNNGYYEIADINDAHKLLAPILGSQLAPTLFAIALIAAGQSSTLTGTLSGQIVMEGHLNLRMQPWLRRLVTRLIAVVPAFLTVYIMGESQTGALLILSQVLLSLQLGFAVIPLIHFVSSKSFMGEFAIKKTTQALAWACALIIVGLNIKFLGEKVADWTHTSENPLIIYLVVIPLLLSALLLLLYVTFSPMVMKTLTKYKRSSPHGEKVQLNIAEKKHYSRIAITIDFSDSDNNAINNAIAQGGKDAEYLLVHIVETAGAMMMENEISDSETGEDRKNIQQYADQLNSAGYKASTKLGFGNPKRGIPEIVNEYKADLLVMGAHGHKGLKDIIFGTTVNVVRHRVFMPVIIVRK